MRPKLSYLVKPFLTKTYPLRQLRIRTRQKILLGRSELLIGLKTPGFPQGQIWMRVRAMGWEGGRMVIHVQ